MDWKLEVVTLPVSDVDRAKKFYAEQCGFAVDVDHRASETFRVVQLTPPGSACSIVIGDGLSSAQPGTYHGLQLVVDDIAAAHAEMAGRGVDVSDVKHFEDGVQKDAPAATGTRSSSSPTRTATAGRSSNGHLRRRSRAKPHRSSPAPGRSAPTHPPSPGGFAHVIVRHVVTTCCTAKLTDPVSTS